MTIFLSLTSGGAAAERGQPTDVALEHMYDVVLSLTSGGAAAKRRQPPDVTNEHLLV